MSIPGKLWTKTRGYNALCVASINPGDALSRGYIALVEVIKALLIEDSAVDAELIVRELESQGIPVSCERVDAEAALRSAMERDWDIIISDYSMPNFDGLTAFGIARGTSPEVPFVFVSGAVGEETAVDAMRAGASDYVMKDNLRRLGPVVKREVREAKVRRRLRDVQHALKAKERRYRSICDAASVALVECDVAPLYPLYDSWRSASDSTAQRPSDASLTDALRNIRVYAANLAALRIVGATDLDSLVAALPRILRPASEAFHDLLQSAPWRDGVFQQQIQIEALDGRLIDVLVSFQTPHTKEDYQSVVVSFADVTERNLLEKQVRAAQRMEAVGRLAGGIAHDFNNVLSVIESYTSLILKNVQDEHMRNDVNTVRDAARRAAGLTRQLLAFSRRQVAIPEAMNLNRVVDELGKMLRRVVGEDVELSCELANDLWLVEMDPSHVEQIVMNLAINARDAMPDGGRLVIRTENVALDEVYGLRHVVELKPGRYVKLSVTDTGIGMDEETQQRVFEPFFTTKGGGGTGLGLSTVYGIVKQAGGFVWVYSEPNQGTTLKVYLPRSEATKESARPTAATPASLEGSETILLVEDDSELRRAVRRILVSAGYRVHTAENGRQALDLCQNLQEPLDALVSDIVMPQVNGRELANALSLLRPETKVLYMSGYTDGALVPQSASSAAGPFIEKPFSADTLLGKLRQVLGAPKY